jgi:hypothetical protein
MIQTEIFNPLLEGSDITYELTISMPSRGADGGVPK